MSKSTLVNIIFIMELVVLIMVCNTITSHLGQLDSAKAEAYNGNVQPAEDLFTDMKEDMVYISFEEITDTIVWIKDLVIEKAEEIYNALLE